ncbi:hypothetical protein LPB72_04360 [Hydrogenophaga crassostreae]|uniref:ABM domain-containing protein n=1 Tax=Hydrogenophaga crassostreae TaxID=1763535 RepID=A0ABX2UB41_9BURK|nr:antibiotic biosynthesis monooxygenase [Hydrogenophaga crassostreae]OAD43749.1 hypothetical protein LPB72_04360 [Hydrogenophaga crassostreae]
MSNNSAFANLPAPPYYVVVFTSQRTSGENGYDTTADRMVELAQSQPGFLGIESARSEGGFGITTSYWTNESSIRAWKQQAEHRIAQEKGKERWYEHFEIRIAKVERAYGQQQQGNP